MNDSKLGSIFATAAKIIAAITVMLFIGLNSINFFTFIFKAEQSMYAYLGFGLTGGGVILYLAILKWDSKTPLNQFVAISMLAVCVAGELATAGFGMRLESLEKLGLEFTASDLDNAVLTVQILALLHALALIMKVGGEDIIQMFKKTSNEKKETTATAIPKADAPNWLKRITAVRKYQSNTPLVSLVKPEPEAEDSGKPEATFS